MGTQRKHNGKTGFSLIELLVVIAIIAILAAVLFPIFTSAKESGRQAQCASNMKQMGIGFQLYLSDWNDQFGYMMWENKGRGPWSSEIWPYVKTRKLAACPTHKFAPDELQQVEEKLRWWMGYSVNRYLHAYDGKLDTYVNMGQIQKPSRTLLLMEQKRAHDFYPFYDWCSYYDIWNDQWPEGKPAGRFKPDPRHNGGSNYTFIDGHVKWMTPEQTIKPEMLWDINPNIP